MLTLNLVELAPCFEPILPVHLGPRVVVDLLDRALRDGGATGGHNGLRPRHSHYCCKTVARDDTLDASTQTA